MYFDFDDLDASENASPTASAEDGSVLSSCDALRVAATIVPPDVKKLFGAAAVCDGLRTIHVAAGRSVRICCISDIHVDAKSNREWLQKHLPPTDPAKFNVLILPGDVSDGLDKLEDALRVFAAAFDLVCFTPGNHDLWAIRKTGPPDSLAKLREVLQVCDEIDNVTYAAVRLVPPDLDHAVVYLVPLLSWYSSDWDREPDLPWYTGTDVDLSTRWTDFAAVKWPEALFEQASSYCQKSQGAKPIHFGQGGTSSFFAEIFGRCNDECLSEVQRALQTEATQRQSLVVSYSHFLPRQELFPEKRFLVDPHLHKVAGSDVLQAQVQKLTPDVHVFGHTHLPLDLVLDGIRYIQWPLGNPSEQRHQTHVVANSGLFVIYDAACGGLAPLQRTFWGDYFMSVGRHPTETCPAPWVRKLFAHLYPAMHLPYDDAYYRTTPHPARPPERGYEWQPQWRC
eukprot:TRINITY_DN48568_c0_g1_i1.p1 TRINITY_DN48568_c0_g1~~TRINITY_DN48568_c0_g1_i1.p1  ORF type:complete len:468 (+),score=77.08 TRINITY_DN48568_c0_g1_i1:47-1405(+)